MSEEKSEFLAYSEEQRVLEITYKTGQVGVIFRPSFIYSRDSGKPLVAPPPPPPTLLRDIHRATLQGGTRPRPGLKAIKVRDSEKMPGSKADTKVRIRIDNQFDVKVRSFWSAQMQSNSMEGIRKYWHLFEREKHMNRAFMP